MKTKLLIETKTLKATVLFSRLLTEEEVAAEQVEIRNLIIFHDNKHLHQIIEEVRKAKQGLEEMFIYTKDSNVGVVG